MDNADIERAERLARRTPEPLNPSALRLMALLGSSASLTEQLEALAHYVESYEPSILCSIMLADESRTTLILTAAPSLPTAWCELVADVAVKDGMGSCGTAAARLAAVIVPDVRASPLWTDFAAAAVSAGLYACWSVPFVDADGLLLGTLALYYRTPRTPTLAERELIDVSAELAALVTMRHQQVASARTSLRRLRELVNRSDAPLMVRRGDQIVYVNTAAVALLGLEDSPGVVHLPLDSITAGTADLERLRQLQAGSDHLHLRNAAGQAVPVRVAVTPEGRVRPESFVLTCWDERASAAREHQASEAMDEHLARVANDLNNEVCQQLTGIEYLVASALSGASPSATEALQLAQLQLQRARRDTSLLAAWLVPPTAATEDLLGALRTHLERVGRESGCAATLDVEGLRGDSLEVRDPTFTYRILARLVSHAAVAPAGSWITVVVTDLPDGMHFRVETDSEVLAPATAEATFGDLKNRAWHMGGVLRFETHGRISRAELVTIH